MRKILFIALALLVPVSAQAQEPVKTWGPDFIAGAGVGYGSPGPGLRSAFVSEFIGLKVRGFAAGALYTAYQHGTVPGMAGMGGHGAKAMFMSPWKKHSDWVLGAGAGFLADLRGDPANGNRKAGLTAEGLLGYNWSEWFEIVAHANAWDLGDVDGDGDNDVGWFGQVLITFKKDIPGT